MFLAEALSKDADVNRHLLSFTTVNRSVFSFGVSNKLLSVINSLSSSHH